VTKRNHPKIKKSAIIRLVAIIIAFGVSAYNVKVNSGLLAELLTIVITFVASMVGYWYDNDVTKRERRRKAKLRELERKEHDKN